MIGTPQTHDFTFSEVILGWAVSEFSTTGASLDGIMTRVVSGSGTIFTITFTPTAATFTLTLAANSITDRSGNQGPAANPVAARSVTGTAVAAGTTPTPTLSMDANLTGLTISAGTLSPAFNAATLGYTVNVANDVASTTITPTTNNDGASVTVDGTAVASTATSGAIDLAIGANAIAIVVTAADTTEQTYTVTVRRAPAAPSLALAADTGSLPDDRITNNGRVNVMGLESGAAWRYTVNGGAVSPTFTTGTGTFFTLDEGDYAVDQVQVVQSLGGADSLPTSLAAVTVDETAPEITRTGAATIPLTLGDPYTDEGATATDDVDSSVVVTTDSSAVLIGTAGTYTVTYDATDVAGNDAEQVTRTVTVNPAPLSTDVDLLSLTITDNNSIAVALAPVFDANADTVDYTAEVGNEVTSITVTPTTNDDDASVTVDGTAVASGAASGAITLTAGLAKAIAIVVTAQDGSAMKTYTVTVTRAASTDADLSSLTLSAGTLSPAFAAATEGYAVSVGNDVASVTVTPTTNDDGASVTVAGTAVTSGATSAAIALTAGLAKAIAIVVTAQDGTATKTYTVTVTRAAPATLSTDADLSGLTISAGTLSPAFAAATEGYAVSVGNDVASITLTPTTNDDGASVTVDGTAVTSGTASGANNLIVGANSIAVVVTAQDGSAMKTYTVTVTRAASADADLSSLTISAGTLPAFAASTISYAVDVDNDVASVTLTPTTNDDDASVTVAGTAVTSGTASGAIDLTVGLAKAIAIVVTAEDGTTTKTYTVTVTRAAPATLSTDADLSGLTISAGTLSPAFAAATEGYAVSVGNDVASITLTPTTNDDDASVTVDGNPPNQAIDLTAGVAKAIAIVVTAEDGSTTKTYTVTVTRTAPAARSADANLSSLTLSAGTLSPTFDAATISYAVSLGNDVASITVTPTTNDDGASVTVAGTAVTSGTASGAIDLTTGVAKAIAIVVTAQDGTATKTYTVTVTRAAPANRGPSVSGEQFVEREENGNTAATTFTANDPEGDTSTWRLTGDDAGLFTIDTDGVLTFNTVPDFEDPQDANADNVYEVNVIATDNGTPNESGRPHGVMITVTNVDEAGAISDISGTVQVGQTLTAGTVTDPDSPSRPVTVTAHQWQGDSTNIDSATSATYTLTAADAGKAIQVIVTYTDGEGIGKTLTSTVTGTVTVPDTTPPMVVDGSFDRIPDVGVIGTSQTHDITFSEVVTGLTAADITATGARVDSVRGSGDTYTITFTPTAAAFTLTLAAGSVEDTAATPNTGPASAASVTGTAVDTTAPEITLLGASPLEVEHGSTFTDPGATAIDDVDGALSASIAVGGDTVDTDTPGDYTITYDVSDAAGNAADTVTRLVIVVIVRDLAKLNAVILPEVARSMADQHVSAIVRRLEQARRANIAGTAASSSFGGAGNLTEIIKAQGRALVDDQFDWKRVLAGSDFVLPLNVAGSESQSHGITLWGAGDYRSLEGAEGVRWDGDLFSLQLGLDVQLNAHTILGVAVSKSQARLDYTDTSLAVSGDYDLDMTSVHPYLGWATGGLDFWATLGYGDGELEISEDRVSGEALPASDLSMQTFALGASGILMETGRTSLRLKGEAMSSTVELDGNEQITAVTRDASRLRMTLEATRAQALDSGAQFESSLEAGMRFDGGDGETSAGAELGASLRYARLGGGLVIEGKARALVGGEAEEWGLSGAISFQPSTNGRGLSFSLTPGYGVTNSGVQQLWQQGLDDGLGAGRQGGHDGKSDYRPRLKVRLDYGMHALRGPGLMTPYTELSLGDKRTYRLGLHWQHSKLFDLKLVTERKESTTTADHRIYLEGELAF